MKIQIGYYYKSFHTNKEMKPLCRKRLQTVTEIEEQSSNKHKKATNDAFKYLKIIVHRKAKCRKSKEKHEYTGDFYLVR